MLQNILKNGFFQFSFLRKDPLNLVGLSNKYTRAITTSFAQKCPAKRGHDQYLTLFPDYTEGFMSFQRFGGLFF